MSQTYSGKTHDKKVAETEEIAYQKQMTLYQDAGFQGYEPKVQKSVQPKKSLARKSWPIKRKKTIVRYPKFVSKWSMLSSTHFRDQAFSECKGCIAKHERWLFGFSAGYCLQFTQSSRWPWKEAVEIITKNLFSIMSNLFFLKVYILSEIRFYDCLWDMQLSHIR